MKQPTSPTLQFGRSWFVELKIGSTASLKDLPMEPFKVTVQVQKQIDPLRGMTVNLMSVDQAWNQIQDLTEIIWPTALDFLNSLAKRWSSWLAQEQAQLIHLQIQTLDSSYGWEINPTGLFYKTFARLQIFAENKISVRKCLLTSRQPLTTAEIKNFSDSCGPATPPDQLFKLMQQSRHFCRVEIFDVFEQFVEFDLR